MELKRITFYHKHPWLLFIGGLVIGAVALSSYNYLTSEKTDDVNNTNNNSERLAVFNITEQDHLWGNPSALVTLVVFNDLTCPYSREYMKTLDEFMKNYQEKIKIIWRHFLLNSNNTAALTAAEVSECAAEQGKFWEFVHQIYASQKELNADFYQSTVKNLELKQEEFQACLTDHRYQGKIKAQYDEGIAKGVTGTPSSFLNGRLITGVLPYYDLAQFIDPLLQ